MTHLQHFSPRRLRRGALIAVGIAGLGLLLACATTTNNPSAAPTTQPAATALVSTAQAAATSIAPTAQAAATAYAPTVQAAATQVAPTLAAQATQTAPLGATVSASEPLRVTDAHLDGADAQVSVQNTSNQMLDISGWSLQVGTARTQLPTGLNIQPEHTVTLHSASGTTTDSDVYLGQDANSISSQVRPGVTIILDNPSGNYVSSFLIPNT